MSSVPEESSRPPEDPRVRFAAERTLLAWVRTGLALMGFGFVVARFQWFQREVAVTFPGHTGQISTSGAATGAIWLGISLVILGVIVTIFSAWEYRRIIRSLSRGEAYYPPQQSLGLIVAILLAGIGIVMAGYLVFL